MKARPDRHPPSLWRDYDIDSIDNRDEGVLRWFAETFSDPLQQYFGARVTGLDRIPDGAALYVANHNGALVTPDSFLFGLALFARNGVEAVPYGLAHEVAFQIPGIKQLLAPMGAVRAGYDTAHRLFQRGAKVMVYPGGDLDAMRPWRDRNKVVFGSRRGYIRLALRENVPIVPVVSAGAHEGFMILTDGRRFAAKFPPARWARVKVWPVALGVPWGLMIGPLLAYLPVRTRILIEALEPVCFDRHGEAAANDAAYVESCHQQVHSAMQQALTRLASERKQLGKPRGRWF